MKDNNFCDFFDRQPEENYERDHGARLDFFVKDFELEKIENQRIGDFGCGYGCLFKRLDSDKNKFFGFDGYASEAATSYCDYTMVDLDQKFSDSFLKNEEQVDVATCLEVIEHVQNPYNLLYEIKKILKQDGLLYLTIPHSSITHNTIYPSLIYPPENFKVFLEQMAFEVKDVRIHKEAFVQVVFTLINKEWSHSKMVWPKSEDKFKNIPPHFFVNI